MVAAVKAPKSATQSATQSVKLPTQSPAMVTPNVADAALIERQISENNTSFADTMKQMLQEQG